MLNAGAGGLGNDVSGWIQLGILAAIVWTMFQWFLKREGAREAERIAQTGALISTLTAAVDAFARFEMREDEVHRTIAARLDSVEKSIGSVASSVEETSRLQARITKLLQSLDEKVEREGRRPGEQR